MNLISFIFHIFASVQKKVVLLYDNRKLINFNFYAKPVGKTDNQQKEICFPGEK
jgi:hypothetical protein